MVVRYVFVLIGVLYCNSSSNMVINKKVDKTEKLSILQVAFLSLKFIVIVFVGSIILSHVAAKSSIILFKYSPFSQKHVLEFQI